MFLTLQLPRNDTIEFLHQYKKLSSEFLIKRETLIKRNLL